MIELRSHSWRGGGPRTASIGIRWMEGIKIEENKEEMEAGLESSSNRLIEGIPKFGKFSSEKNS